MKCSAVPSEYHRPGHLYRTHLLLLLVLQAGVTAGETTTCSRDLNNPEVAQGQYGERRSEFNRPHPQVSSNAGHIHALRAADRAIAS